MPEAPLPTCDCCFVSVPLRYFSLCALVIQTTSAVILTRYSKIVSTGPPYHSTTMVVMSESWKFFLSLALVFFVDVDPAGSSHSIRSQGIFKYVSSRAAFFGRTMRENNFDHPLDTLKLAVPAIFYTIQNNLVYVALANLEATTFQVGYQMKVITTALLSVIILKRHLSSTKWVALLLLTAGIVMTQVEGNKASSDVQETDIHPQYFLVGLSSVIACGFCSAFAGVYFEYILKGTNPSVWVRNAQLAFFGTIIGLIGTAYIDGVHIQFFEGYNALTWSIVAVQAGGGLIVAVVIKYADNILKGFAAALSIVLCGVLSIALFGFFPSLAFALGSVVVIVATFLYSKPDNAPILPLFSSSVFASHSHLQTPTVESPTK